MRIHFRGIKSLGAASRPKTRPVDEPASCGGFILNDSDGLGVAAGRSPVDRLFAHYTISR